MKAFFVLTVSRQIGGEYVFVKAEKAFTKASSADDYLNKMKSQLIGPDGNQIPITIKTPQGEATCYCEIGVFEIEIEEGEINK